MEVVRNMKVFWRQVINWVHVGTSGQTGYECCPIGGVGQHAMAWNMYMVIIWISISYTICHTTFYT